MRIVVTGTNGQVGWELVRSLLVLGEIIGLNRSQCDLSKPHTLNKLLDSLKPDIIVNAAAYTAVDKAEEEEALATLINGESAGVLAEWCKKNRALLVHYSTDYVFDGSKRTPYIESDIPSPINAYGRSKLAGERAIQQVGGDWLIFRTSWVYASRGHNFLKTMLRLAQEREELSVVADQIGSPTWARFIADVTLIAIQHACIGRNSGEFVSELYHLTSSGRTSWHGFAEFIMTNARMLIEEQITTTRVLGIKTSEYPTAAVRPRFSCLNNAKLTDGLGISCLQWETYAGLCIRDCIPK